MSPRILLVAPLALALAACGASGDGNTQKTTPATAATASQATPGAAAPAASTPATATSAAAAPAAATSASTAGNNAAPAASNGMSAAARAAMAKAASQFVDNGKWVEGKHYFLIQPQQPKVTNTHKVEVVEVFNWGCPACNAAHKMMDKLKAELPSYATMTYLPAGFRPDENWVLYQRTYLTAKALGLADKSYDAMFEATWKTGETASYNLGTGRLNPKSKWADLQDVAKFYHDKYGVPEKKFIAIANSFAIDTQIKRADKLVKSYGVLGTPTLVIDGKYRYGFQSAGGYAQGIALTKWLVAKEAKRLADAAAAK